MHTYELITDQAELDSKLVPVLAQNGLEIPQPGCYIAAVEFDESGAVVAYQMLQNALFLEGMWSRDGSAHLLRLYRMASAYAADKLGAKSIMTMTRDDETGNRIGGIAERLGFQKMKWNIFRRAKCL
jgi:hypothetical protein